MPPPPKVFLQEREILHIAAAKTRSDELCRAADPYRFEYVRPYFFPIDPDLPDLADTLRLPSGYNSKWWKVFALSFDKTVDEKGVISDVETESVEQFSSNTGS